MLLRCVAAREGKLESFLRRELSMSSSLVSRLKWQNALLVNGQSVHTNHPVRPGDEIAVRLDETAEGFEPEELPLEILYEDEALIALDKPAGMLTHPSPCRNDGTLANGVLDYYQKTGQRCGVHPVSRLDRDTFGVVLLAKNAYVHEKFRLLHQCGGIRKTYEACVFGAPEQESGVIDLPVYKIGGGSLIRTVDARGQSAVTEFTVVTRWERTALLRLHPVTGRTHQLRLHCMASGFPILGDPQYHSEDSRAFSERSEISPQQLCAVQLEFGHPITGENVVIRSRQRVRCPEAEQTPEKAKPRVEFAEKSTRSTDGCT